MDPVYGLGPVHGTWSHGTWAMGPMGPAGPGLMGRTWPTGGRADGLSGGRSGARQERTLTTGIHRQQLKDWLLVSGPGILDPGSPVPRLRPGNHWRLYNLDLDLSLQVLILNQILIACL